VTVESTREIGETVTTAPRYYVGSLPPVAARIVHAVRSHCGIENGMHRRLEMAFGEDQYRVRVDNADQNFAILRRTTLNQLPQDCSTKAEQKIRRLKACTNDFYRAQILGWHGS
jgi:predicted transposase YbfD/YdcC